MTGAQEFAAMARLASTAAHFCHRLQELYPQKLALNNKQSEQSSPFRRWTTGSGAGSSYRHTDHRALYNKQMSEGPALEPSGSGGGSPGQWPNGGVARWSLGLEQLLADPVGAAAFAAFLDKEFSHENITFWSSCEAYNNLTDPAQRAQLAREIWERHLADGAPDPVNIDASARRATMHRLSQEIPPPEMFQQAQRQVFNVMKFDSYPRFLRSSVHAECARADLRGQPPPYGPAPGAGPVAGPSGVTPQPPPPTSGDSTPSGTSNPSSGSKIKKSASNASERRRSGGASLLPWKLRVPSRERAPRPAAAAAPPTNTPSSASAQPLITDVVKSGALCRVVLPDGATSVVSVEPTVPVRRLVDRLLQRLNLLTLNYDVLLKDAQQGESAVIDANAPSTVLGGREVVVERRCVVRVEVGARVVAVRCRPARRLRHVLRPVLARYAPAAAHRAATRDGTLLHPDTPMQDLDGARLQIVDLSDSSDSLRERSRDDDTDSMSDFAVRVQDDRDDDQQSVGRGAVRAEAPSAAAAPGAPPGSRVRAALRAGPPLHHHPPDFLENLRETQRQRLQNMNEPSPAPRTPPPLPPKPSTRAPTLV